MTEKCWLISPHLNKHLYLLESPLVINRSVTQSCVLQVHPAQTSFQGHSFKQGQEKYVSCCQKGQEKKLVENMIAGHLTFCSFLPGMNRKTLGRKLECSPILKNQQFPLQNALFSHFFPCLNSFGFHHPGFLILVNQFQPCPMRWAET